MKVSKDEIYDLYSKYYLADKTVSQLTDEKALEVSDAEAKVIRILQIETDTEEKAETLWKRSMSQKLILLLSLKKSRAAARSSFSWSGAIH